MTGAGLPGQPPAPPQSRSRRTFLIAAGGAVGVAAAGGAALAGLRHGSGGHGQPGHSSAPPSRSSSPSAPPARLEAGDWSLLGRTLSTGRLVRPADADYATARQLFDPRFDSLRPAAVAYCGTAADVSACLRFAHKFGLPLAARAGGHSYAGWSSTTGLIIDVSSMSAVRVNPATGLARVGAGTRLIDLYSRLASAGRAVPGGSCPTVGVAGLALGGGVGVTGRLYGLTCDNVESVQVVTADGVIRECSQSASPALFWACRGGGGGNFGVVTAFTLRTHPAPSLVLFFLRWPWSQAGPVIAAWQGWAPSAPDALWSNVHLAAAPGGGTPSISVGGTFAGSTGGLQSLLSQLYAQAGSQPDSSFMQPQPYLSAMLVEAGCASLSAQQCHLPSQTLAGQLSRQPELAKSAFFGAPLPAAGIRALLAGVAGMQQVAGVPGSAGGVAFDACGGAINRVQPGATAFVHRSALFLAQYTTTWPASAGTGGSGAARQLEWLRGFHAAMQRYASGQAYQNYIDPELAHWQQAYYGANYPRLQQVKAAVDPGDVFRFPQSVELPGS